MGSEQKPAPNEQPHTGSTVAEPGTPVPGEAAPPVPVSGGLPRWLIVLIGLAAATVAVAGLRSVGWLIGPVFLALVVVIALSPVQTRLRRAGVPRWLATAVLLVLVWTVLLLFVGLLVISAAELAALLPNYSEEAQRLINDLVAELNDARLVQGTVSDLVQQIDYGQVVGVASGVLGSLTDTAS